VKRVGGKGGERREGKKGERGGMERKGRG